MWQSLVSFSLPPHPFLLPPTSLHSPFSSLHQTELHRVIIHGVLHLCGINDKGPGEREIMEEAENKALEKLKELKNKN